MESNANKSFLEDFLGIEFTACKSSNIEAFGFDPAKNDLWILFKGSIVYRYENQTQEAYNNLCAADSKGSWVNQNLVKTKAKCYRHRIQTKSSKE